MDPIKQQLSRAELIEFVNDITREVIQLRMNIESLKKQTKAAEETNEIQQQLIQSLTEENVIRHYGPPE
tara:strand:- start:8012 stop:8218 length:207 start_codon:yes stop_codon:yes gene_type:complete